MILDHYERAYKFFLIVFILIIGITIITCFYLVYLFSQLFIAVFNPLGLTVAISNLTLFFMPVIIGMSTVQAYLQYSTVKKDMGVIGGDFGVKLEDHVRMVKFFKFVPISIIIPLVMIIIILPLLLNPIGVYIIWPFIIWFLIVPIFILAIIEIFILTLSIIAQILLAIYIYHIGGNSGNNLLEIGAILTIFVGFVGILLIGLGLKQLNEQK